VAFRATGCLCFYLISLPMVTNGGFYVFTIWDAYTGSFPLLIVGITELIALMYIYGYNNFADDVSMMLGRKPFLIFRIAWCVVTPAVIVAVIIFTGIQYSPTKLFSGMDEYNFPAWSEGIGWLIVTACLIFIPVGIIYQIIKASRGRKFSFKIIKEISKPMDIWGPASKANWTGRYARLPTYEQANGQPPVYTTPVVMKEGTENRAFEEDANNNVGKTGIEMASL